MSMGGRVEGLACTKPGARTPIGASGNFNLQLCCLEKTLNYEKQVSEVLMFELL